MRTRVRVCQRAELLPGTVLAIPLPKSPDDRRPREALVLLGSDGEPRAYLNRCKHLPIPIDAGSRQFLTPDRQHLMCGTHGALYRLNDGVCVVGPCMHIALEKLPLCEEDGVLFLEVLE